jgi:hypothetical protein
MQRPQPTNYNVIHFILAVSQIITPYFKPHPEQFILGNAAGVFASCHLYPPRPVHIEAAELINNVL